MIRDRTPADHLHFALSGEAIITLRSRRTGREFTYRIMRAPLHHLEKFYVDLLESISNESRFDLLGTITNNIYRWSFASTVPHDDDSTIAFEFFWSNLLTGHIHPDLEIIHKNAMELDSPHEV